MGITTLLSMTVFMMLVAENMPPTSDVLPLIGTCISLRDSTVLANNNIFVQCFTLADDSKD